MLERMDKVEKPMLERRRMGLELNGWRGSQKVLEIVDLDKAFPADDGAGDEQIVLAGLDLLIWHGERVGLLGPNGAGKSVLFRCILGQEEPTGGRDQDRPQRARRLLCPGARDAGPGQDPDRGGPPGQAHVRAGRRCAFWGTSCFPTRWSRKRVRDLSGGERSRLQLAKLMLSDANFLLLDEPTNNLDLPSCEVLENALDEFEGTVLVISHDRYFLDRVVDRIVELEEGALTEYPGDYTYYAEKKAQRT